MNDIHIVNTTLKPYYPNLWHNFLMRKIQDADADDT